MRVILNPDYDSYFHKINQLVLNFDSSGKMIGDGARNKVKKFNLDATAVNIKSFKIPGFFNKFIYRFIRQSKASRSFGHANHLIKSGFLTPLPIGFYEQYSAFALHKSYYISQHLEYDFMLRDLVENPQKFDVDTVVVQFAKFCFELHEKNINFLDHSPGNTLIKKQKNGNYLFYLVDLNRMIINKKLSFNDRMNNLKRLFTQKNMIAIFTKEYARNYNMSEQKVFNALWLLTDHFQDKYRKKNALKKLIKIN